MKRLPYIDLLATAIATVLALFFFVINLAGANYTFALGWLGMSAWTGYVFLSTYIDIHKK
jgi:hypothetical protein